MPLNVSLARCRCSVICAAGLHGMSLAVGLKCARELRFDLIAGGAVVELAELDANSGVAAIQFDKLALGNELAGLQVALTF